MPTNKLSHAFRLEEHCCYNKIKKEYYIKHDIIIIRLYYDIEIIISKRVEFGWDKRYRSRFFKIHFSIRFPKHTYAHLQFSVIIVESL